MFLIHIQIAMWFRVVTSTTDYAHISLEILVSAVDHIQRKKCGPVKIGFRKYIKLTPQLLSLQVG